MTQAIEDRIRRVVSEVFELPMEKVNDDTSPDTVPNWDSLLHINLILSLEAEFGVSLSPEEAMELLSVRLIRIILEERVINRK